MYVNQYSGQYVKLLADLSVSEMVGTSQSKSFRGTFLGNNKMLTFTIEANSSAAPFRYVSGATIRDLKVAGDIYTSKYYAAGLIAYSYGTTTVTNCHVGIDIRSSYSYNASHGGIVANQESGTLTIDGCAYTGRLLTNNGATNCYYTETMGTAQGAQVYAYDAAPANLGDAVVNGNYGFITAYANGILFDGKYYVAPATVTLADNSDNSTVLSSFAGQAANVTLQGRTLYRDGDWNTLCLPFDLVLEGSSQSEASQGPSAVLEGATVMTLSTDGTGFDPATGTLTLNFEPATAIEAGKPYIVKWTKAEGYDEASADTRDVKNPVFSGVQIKNIAPATAAFTSADGIVTFTGTFSPEALTPDDKSNLFLGTANTLYYPNAANSDDGSYYVNACRAYFHVNLSGQANGVRAFKLNFDDDESTGFVSISKESGSQGAADGWNTFDGRKLNGKPSRAGVYINNGVKVVIK